MKRSLLFLYLLHSVVVALAAPREAVAPFNGFRSAPVIETWTAPANSFASVQANSFASVQAIGYSSVHVEVEVVPAAIDLPGFVHTTTRFPGRIAAIESGRELEFETPDGGKGRAWEWKAPRKINYTLMLFHDARGLTNEVREQAEKLGKALGINVLAIDLYDGKAVTNSVEAAKMTHSVDEDRATAIIEGAFTYLGDQQKVFTLGWSFGGGWSLQAAIIGGSQVAGCIVFYGPLERQVKKLQLLQCDVMGFFGNKDKWPSPEQVTEFNMNMQKAGKKLQANRYPAAHGFADPGNDDAEDKVSAADTYIKTINFIQGRLK